MRTIPTLLLFKGGTVQMQHTGDRKGVTEPAIEQKNIADFFWANGDLSGVIDYQIAEGDLVATRWEGRGRHTGELMGIGPTGKDAVVSGLTLSRVAGLV